MKSNEKVIIFICALCLLILILVTTVISTVKAIRRMDYDIAQQKDYNLEIGRELLVKAEKSNPTIDQLVSSYIAELNAIGLTVDNYQIKNGKKNVVDFKFSCDEKHLQHFISSFHDMQSSRYISSMSILSDKDMCVVKSTVTRNFGRMHEIEGGFDVPANLFFHHDSVPINQINIEVTREVALKKTEFEKHVDDRKYTVLGYVNGYCYVKDNDGKISLLSE